MTKQKTRWYPEGAKELSGQQIAYDTHKKILYFRKYKSTQNKVHIRNIVAIRVEGHDIHVSHRGPQKVPFGPGFCTGTSLIIKKGVLSVLEKIFGQNEFLRISRNTLMRTSKISKGGSEKHLCAVYYRDVWIKKWYVGEEYPVDKKYQNVFQKFLDGKLPRPRKKAGRFL